jgi:hypothetical protein
MSFDMYVLSSIKRLSVSFQMFELCYKCQDLWNIFKLCVFVLHVDAYTKIELISIAGECLYTPPSNSIGRGFEPQAGYPNQHLSSFSAFPLEKFQGKIPHIRHLPYTTITTIDAAYIQS